MLKWNVYIGNFNSKEIEIHNIFDHCRFWEDCIKNKKKNKNNKEEFVKQLRTDLQYYYWCKCEWEVTIHHFPESKRMKDKKVDVYQQVIMNWDRFIDYLWDNKEELK